MGDMYVKNREQVEKDLRFESVTNLLNSAYHAFVNDKEIEKIESLPLNKKAELWERAKKIHGDNVMRIKISRSIYLLEKITE
jgi:hypothetical protein